MKYPMTRGQGTPSVILGEDTELSAMGNELYQVLERKNKISTFYGTQFDIDITASELNIMAEGIEKARKGGERIIEFVNSLTGYPIKDLGKTPGDGRYVEVDGQVPLQEFDFIADISGELEIARIVPHPGYWNK